MSEIRLVSGNSNISSNQVAQEHMRTVPAQIKSSLSASVDVSTKSCFEAFFEFIEWVCSSLFCCFKMSDLQVKEIVEQILELCKKKSETTEENAKKPDEYLKLYFQLPDAAREEIKKIAIQYVCCGGIKNSAEMIFFSFSTKIKKNWVQKKEGSATKAATDLLKKMLFTSMH